MALLCCLSSLSSLLSSWLLIFELLFYGAIFTRKDNYRLNIHWKKIPITLYSTLPANHFCIHQTLYYHHISYIKCSSCYNVLHLGIMNKECYCHSYRLQVLSSYINSHLQNINICWHMVNNKNRNLKWYIYIVKDSFGTLKKNETKSKISRLWVFITHFTNHILVDFPRLQYWDIW